MKKQTKKSSPKHKLIINGYEVKAVAPAEMLSEILSTPFLDYWSYDALRDFYCGAIEVVGEFCGLKREEVERSQKAQLTRFSSVAGNLLRYVPATRSDLLRKIYDTILSGNRLGRLSGFGMSNRFGDEMVGNPEYSSVYK